MFVVRIWDLPTRVFHWTLMASVLALIVTGQIGGVWMLWHFRFGYLILSLLLFRLVWGFVGGHWSRFSTFAHAPKEVLAYLRQNSAAPAIGHNPLGGYSVLAMMLILFLQATSGLFSDDEIFSAGPFAAHAPDGLVRVMSGLHTGPIKFALFFLLLLHVAAILWYRVRRHESLVGPMIHGDKRLSSVAPAAKDNQRSRWLALALFLGIWAAVTSLVFLLGA